MTKQLWTLAIWAMLLNGCASIMNGSYQNFKVATNNNFDVSNTRCNLSNYKGAWQALPNTTLVIHRDSNVLDIRCENANQVGTMAIQPDFQGIYLVNDLLFGAIISSLVDHYNNAFYQYTPIAAIDMQAK